MDRNKTARRSGNCKRAETRPGRTQQIIAEEYERGTRWAAIILGIAFGVMFALGIIGG